MCHLCARRKSLALGSSSLFSHPHSGSWSAGRSGDRGRRRRCRTAALAGRGQASPWIALGQASPTTVKRSGAARSARERRSARGRADAQRRSSAGARWRSSAGSLAGRGRAGARWGARQRSSVGRRQVGARAESLARRGWVGARRRSSVLRSPLEFSNFWCFVSSLRVIQNGQIGPVFGSP